ncbi:hypothetical protein KP509_09G012500 [Ceratopteris richardii]|uniref:Endoplasmic reticulum transmembrane protein n=1 Tax=Ceratopteris richardii TaxID=49495 RepID=A0A8T2U481_CERRI|nr:hypothetical protein KP509_09G012500 [Ceratopteris richardii]
MTDLLLLPLLVCVVLVEAGASAVLMFGKSLALYSTFLWMIQCIHRRFPSSAAGKGFAGSLSFAVALNLFRIYIAWNRVTHAGPPVVPPEHLTLRVQFLEAGLIGLSFYLYMVICKLHAQITTISVLQKELQTLKRQERAKNLEITFLPNNGKLLWKEEESSYVQKIQELECTIENLKITVKDLQMESILKTEEIKAAESNTKALQRQSEGFLLEYDRLLEENQVLHKHLSLFDRKLHRSDSNTKKP